MAKQDASPAAGAADSTKPAWMRGVEKLSDLCISSSMYILYPAILLVIMIDVIGRNFFNTPLSWAIEGSGLFLIGAIFLAAPRVELTKTHIMLDILYARYPQKMKALCDLVTRIIIAFWMAGATIRSAMEVHTAFLLNESGSDFRYPFWPMRVIMTFSFFVITLTLIYNIVSAYKQLRNGGLK